MHSLIILLLCGSCWGLSDADIFAQQRAARPRKTHHHYSYAKPNIILILTDDQDVELGSMNFMPKTLRTIRDQGAEFRHAYVTTPMCCPSRSSLLTGMYVHNHNVYTNNDNCSSAQWQATHETRSFATYLSNAGYRTGYFGKYLNKYNGSYIPPGWREWGGLIMNSKYYNYSINMNGKRIKHGFDYHKDYYPDLILNDSIAFLRQSKKNNANKPVMLTMSFPAPHGPEDSAPQYSHLFFNITTHHTPSYDFAPNPDKQWILQITNKMKPIHREFTDLLMTKRLQTLQSVDAAVYRVVQELEALGELDNTYIVYTSDHGYHLGQFGLIKGKSFPFEFDVRVPFLVRGPGVEPGTVVDDIVLNIDLAPTFLDMAGVEAPAHMDGRSVLPLFLNSKRKRNRWPDTFLIESSGRRDTPESRAKAHNKYSESANKPADSGSSTTEAYEDGGLNYTDLISTSTEPMVSKGRDLFDSMEEAELDADEDDDDIEDDAEEDDEELLPRSTSMQLDNRVFPEFHTKFERLAVECRQDEFQQPCKIGQKWYCQRENERWRKHKCKQQLQFPQKAYKKCACFTSKGLVYKKIPINATVNTVQKHRNHNRLIPRNRRDILFRMKRDTLTHVENVMENIQTKLDGLQAVNATLPEEDTVRINLDTNKISETTPGCTRLEDGRISCPSVIYKDRKSWRRSRTHIDNEIQRLKQQLENLKEIRRHLKHAKPTDANEFNTTTERVDNNVDIAPRFEGGYVMIPEASSTASPRGKKGGVGGKRRKTTATPQHQTNHHRHQHHRFNATTRKPHHAYSTTEYTTMVPNTTDYNDEVTNSSNESYSTTDNYYTSTSVSTTEKVRRPQPTEQERDYCHCQPEEPYRPDEKDVAREERRRIKEERLKKKARKLKKKAQLEKECLSEKIHCFRHDNDHWRTAPLWTSGPFCVCMNANNNTYSCLRTINSTHNLLYCEFVTGLATYYNLRIDPFELQNRIEQLHPEEKQYLKDQLKELKSCRGRTCTVGSSAHNFNQSSKSKPNLLPNHPALPQPQRYNRKRKTDDFSAARTLPLLPAQSRSDINDRDGRLIKLPKSWRRRKSWLWRPNARERVRRKQQALGKYLRKSNWRQQQD